MFYKHKDFSETLVHQCADADKQTQDARQKMANVRKHDIAAYLSVPLRDYNCRLEKAKTGSYPIKGHEVVAITHCPYCGVNLDTDESTNEELKLALE